MSDDAPTPDAAAMPAEIGAAAVDRAFEDIQYPPPDAAAEHIEIKNGNDAMEIHKPKPVHSWREFMTELGVVVLGICIALGAEQVVERMHEGQIAGEASAMVRSELRTNLQTFLNRRATQTCIDRRLEDITKLIADSDQPGYKPPSWIGRPMIEILNAAGWEAASQSGRAALLNETEQTEFGHLYSQLHELNLLERDEQKAWADIRQLENQPRVDPQMRAAVRSALQQARLLSWNIKVDLEQSQADAEKLGIIDKNFRPKGAPSVCLPTDTPRAAAIAQSNKFWGDKLGEP